MAHLQDDAPSAEIERAIEQDRQRIGEKIDAIQQRMSPGQMVDEVLTYARSSGAGEYASNLGNAFKNNPLPLALMGVSLAWLMAAPKTTVSAYADRDEVEYPLATIHGSLRRSGPIETHEGSRYSRFVDESGSRFKALTDETGRRAGHFVDDAGKSFRGFMDASGKQVHDIRDETGRLFDQASGWASHAWQQVKQSTGQMGSSLSGAGQRGADLGSQLSDSIVKQFRDQPLVGGALAFAVGAAIGAALPSTRPEDAAFGEISDKAKETISKQASQAIDKAEGIATDLYDRAVSVAADVHDVARDRIAEEAQAVRGTGDREGGEQAGASRPTPANPYRPGGQPV